MKIVKDIKEVFKSHLKSGNNIFIQGAMQTPVDLLSELKLSFDVSREQSHNLDNLGFVHLHTHGEPFYREKEYIDHFRVINFFVGHHLRKDVNHRNIDYIPCFLSEIPYLIRNKAIQIDVSFIQVSPPDEHGYVSLGSSVDVTKEAIKASKIVIAQINHYVPRTYGDSFIHVDQINYAIEKNSPLQSTKNREVSENEKKIGELIANEIEDGSTLQMGIGAIPDAVLSSLTNHKNLGVHTEMFSDGIIELMEKNIINNSKKKLNPGKTISSFAVGSEKLINFMNNNPSIEFYPANYVNKPKNIAKNPKVVAINSAVEIDLSAQVCADSIGHRIISGVGGQMDFIRGASISEGGKPIIAMCSTTSHGRSKIVPTLKPGAGVVTTRAHIHYVVTEYGLVNLYGKSIGERAKLLTSIAHPDHREDLEKKWYDILN